ncbi:MAG: hypothetical protein JNL64_03555 [Blastocatellia bacterium]|nr:hypothetical protein [Blastocatellia bacterium]
MNDASAATLQTLGSKAASSSRVSSWLVPTVVLLSIASLITIERNISPAVPINVDPAYYAVVSHELLNGERLYTDIWDHKPPAPFIVYGAAELLFGYGPATLLTLNLILTLLMLVLLFLVGRRGPGGDISGYIAAATWAIVSGSIGLEGRDPNTEIMMNVCLTGAFLMFVNSKDGMTRSGAIVGGLLFLIATMFKPVVVAAALLICLANLMFARDRNEAVRSTAIISGIGVIGWAATFGYFAWTGRAAIFADSMVAFNRSYSGSIVGNLIAPLTGDAELLIDVIGPIAVIAAGLFVLVIWFDRRLAALVAAFVAAGWFGIAAPGRFSVHYYQLWLPPLIIASAWGIGVLMNSEKRLVRWASPVVIGLLFGGLIATQISEYKTVIAGEHTPVVKKLAHSAPTLRFIRENLEPNETFFLWGITTNMYLLAERRPPAAVIFDGHLENGPMFATLSSRVISDLNRERPELLVVEHGRPPVPSWISDGYDTKPIFDDPNGYAVYARRDGRLGHERR